jgi:hypothetical protein
MKKCLVMAVVLMLSSVLNGCTNYLYQGSIKAEDSAGKQRQVVLYWSKTEPFIGDEKADMAHLLTECGSLVVFENQPSGIIFRGEPQRDRLVNPQATTGGSPAETMECGRIQGPRRLVDVGRGKVSLTIQCEPVSGEFSVQKRTYLKAREAAYDFEVTEKKKWSFLGSTPAAPKVPDCKE